MSEQPITRHGGSIVLCWLLILASVGYVAGRVFVQGRTAPSEPDNFQLELSSRLLVGQKVLMKDLDQAAQPANTTTQDVDVIAKSPEQKLRAAIVAGEVVSGEEALTRLRALRSDATTNKRWKPFTPMISKASRPSSAPR